MGRMRRRAPRWSRTVITPAEHSLEQMRRPRQEVTGTIILVSEDRFRLVDDLGRGYLFTLSHKAAARPHQLTAWADAARKVQVIYRGEPDMGALAEEVRPLEAYA